MAILTSTSSKFGARTRTLFTRLGITPTEQQIPILSCTKRGMLVSGGFQAGKSFVSALVLIKRFIDDLMYHYAHEWPLPVVYWLVAEDYSGTQREFEYLRDWFMTLFGQDNIKASKGVDPGDIEIGRSPVIAIIKTKSANDYKSLRMEAPAGMIACEGSQLDLVAYDRLRERMAPHQGWLLISGTMEMSFGWFVQMHKAWQFGTNNRQSFLLPSYSNVYQFPGGIDDEEIISLRNDLTAAQFAERVEGVPTPVTGLVFPEFTADFHVADIKFDPMYDVQLWEDPGFGTYAAHAIEVVQIIDDQVRIIDEIYVGGETTEDIINNRVMIAPWWRNMGGYVGDPHYGTQHHSTESIEEIWRRLTGWRNMGERQNVLPRIERTKNFLKVTADGNPRFLVAPHCTGLLSEAGLVPNPIDKREHPYRWKVNKDGEILAKTPEDRWNDAWEAVGRGLVANFGVLDTNRRRGMRIIGRRSKR